MAETRISQWGHDRWKPEEFMHWLSIAELADFIDRHETRIRMLERQGRIPRAKRVRHGRLQVRLYSPEQAKEIKVIVNGLQRGKARRK